MTHIPRPPVVGSSAWGVTQEQEEYAELPAWQTQAWDNMDSPHLLPQGRGGSGLDLLLGLHRPKSRRELGSLSLPPEPEKKEGAAANEG